MIRGYIEQQQNKIFQFGENDCYTLIRGYIDLKFPENKLPKHDYNDFRSAVRWNKEKDWITEIKKNFVFEIIEQDFKNGDLLIIRDDWQCAHLFCDDYFYSFDKVYNLVNIHKSIYKNIKVIRLIRSL